MTFAGGDARVPTNKLAIKRKLLRSKTCNIFNTQINNTQRCLNHAILMLLNSNIQKKNL